MARSCDGEQAGLAKHYNWNEVSPSAPNRSSAELSKPNDNILNSFGQGSFWNYFFCNLFTMGNQYISLGFITICITLSRFLYLKLTTLLRELYMSRKKSKHSFNIYIWIQCIKCIRVLSRKSWSSSRVDNTEFLDSLSRHPSLCSITSDRSSRLHLVSAQSWYKFLLVGQIWPVHV